MQEIAGLVVIDVAPARLSLAARAVKRTSDLVIGGLSLLFALPVLAAASIAIKVTSPGPVLFRQERINASYVRGFGLRVAGKQGLQGVGIDGPGATGLRLRPEPPPSSGSTIAQHGARFDSVENEVHIADGSGYLCDRLRSGYERRRAEETSVIPTHQGQLNEVTCSHCVVCHEHGTT